MVRKNSVLHFFTVIALALVGIAAVASQSAPSQQRPPTFRSAIDVVPLTVTVLDRKGQPIKDLTASDFTVTEGGRSREILSFFPQEFVPLRETGLPEPDRNGLYAQTNRTFLIVLGYGRIRYPTQAFKGAIDFVRNRLLPQDSVALMAFHRVTPFTTDHEALARIIERYQDTHEKLMNDLWESSLNNVKSLFGHPHYREAGLVLADMDAVLAGVGPLRNTADLLFGMDRGIRPTDRVFERQESFAEVVNSLDGESLTGLTLNSSRFKIVAGVEYLRDRQGDKHLVILANGGFARSVDDAVIVARRASDARVVVDIVGTAGTPLGSANRSPAADLAQLTGGYYTTVEMATKALTKIDDATRFSYLVGYAPANPEMDGRYRDVQVKVNRRDVVVRFRHGYYAAPEPDPVELKELVIKARLEAALAYTANATEVPVTATGYMLPRMGLQASARIEVAIDASGLTWAENDGVRSADIEVQVYCGDKKENVIGDDGERWVLEAGEAQYQAWLQTGIRRVIRVPVNEEPAFVKVVVYDYGSDKVGSFIFTMKK